MPDGSDIVGLGVFTISEAARLTRVPEARIRTWVFGHGGPSAVEPELSSREGQEALSFTNLIEVRFLRDLREEGVKWSTIRRIVETAQRFFGSAHPFALERFHTDGKTVYAETAEETGDRSLVDLMSGNGAMLSVLEQSFRRSVGFTRPGGMAGTWWPRPELTRIVVDATRRFGRPIDQESGVPTAALADALRAEKGNVERVARWWKVPPEAVNQAAEFEMLLNRRKAA